MLHHMGKNKFLWAGAGEMEKKITYASKFWCSRNFKNIKNYPKESAHRELQESVEFARFGVVLMIISIFEQNVYPWTAGP